MTVIRKLAGLSIALLTLSAASDAAYCQYRDVVRTAAYNSAATVRAPILPVDDEQPSASGDSSGGPAIAPQTASPGKASGAAPSARPAAVANTTTAGTAPALSPAAPAAAEPAVAPAYESTNTGQFPPPPPFNPALVSPLPMMQPVPYYSNLFDQAMCGPPACMLEQPGMKTGWLFSAGTGLLKPYIHSTQSSTGLAFTGGPPTFAGTVQLPVAQPNWAAMPEFNLGYRFEGGLGELRTNVQFMNSQGTGTLANFDPAGAAMLTSRLNLDVIDFQYVNTEALPVRLPWISPMFMIPGRLGLDVHQENQPTYPPILFTYYLGVRLATSFYDTTAVGGLLSQRSMNNFIGAGPQVGLQLQTPTRWQALTVHSKLLASGVVGNNEQSFSAVSALPAIGSGRAVANASDGLAMLDIEFGLSYVPSWRQGLCRFTTGYKLQQWWFLGQATHSEGELTLQGLFFRGEIGF